MIQLRPYQQQARTSLSDSLARYGSAVLCMPTGSGKTVVFCGIAKRVVQNNMVVMVMCDRKELIYQAEEKLNANGLYPTLIMPGEPQVKNSSYVASVDTLKRRELPAIDVLICDEAHKQTFDKIVKEYRQLHKWNSYPDVDDDKIASWLEDYAESLLKQKDEEIERLKALIPREARKGYKAGWKERNDRNDQPPWTLVECANKWIKEEYWK